MLNKLFKVAGNGGRWLIGLDGSRCGRCAAWAVLAVAVSGAGWAVLAVAGCAVGLLR